MFPEWSPGSGKQSKCWVTQEACRCAASRTDVGIETVKAQWFAENQWGEAPDSGADY